MGNGCLRLKSTDIKSTDPHTKLSATKNPILLSDKSKRSSRQSNDSISPRLIKGTNIRESKLRNIYAISPKYENTFSNIRVCDAIPDGTNGICANESFVAAVLQVSHSIITSYMYIQQK